MDTPNRDQLRERRLEEALARRMGEALDRLSPRTGGDCPDAEVIAAYHEQALLAEESAQWESHFAGCSRCRKILAVLGASVEEPLAESEVARLGEQVRTAQAPPFEKPESRAERHWDWRMRWLVPALGLAGTLAVWFAVRPPWRQPGQEASGTLVAQAPEREELPNTQSADKLSNAAPPQDQMAQGANSRDLSAGANVPPPNPQANALPERAPDSSNANFGPFPGAISPAPPPEAKNLDNLGNENPTRTAGPPAQADKAGSGSAGPMSNAQTVMATGGVPVVPAVGSAPGGTVTAPAGAPPALALQASPRASLMARNNQSLSRLKSAGGASPLVKSPAGSTTWRFGTGGTIERSTNGGLTWTAQPSPSSEDWLDGDATSDTVVWLVGRNGAVARTTDGEHWERVTPPAQAADSSAKSPDWVGVAARDALIATIAARDGRRFLTQDGGKTWKIQ